MIRNLVGAEWRSPATETPSLPVYNPATGDVIEQVSRAASLDDAIRQANRMALGNMATIFTQSGKAAHEFRERVEAGMTGINVHGTDGIDFFTRKKVVVTRW